MLFAVTEIGIVTVNLEKEKTKADVAYPRSLDYLNVPDFAKCM